MLTDKHLPSYVTVDQIEGWLDKIALEIAALEPGEDPEACILWYEWLEQELRIAKERDSTLERARNRIETRGLEVPEPKRKVRRWRKRPKTP